MSANTYPCNKLVSRPHHAHIHLLAEGLLRPQELVVRARELLTGTAPKPFFTLHFWQVSKKNTWALGQNASTQQDTMANSKTTASYACGRAFEAARVGSSCAMAGCSLALTLFGRLVEISPQADSSSSQHHYSGAAGCVKSAIVWSTRRQDGFKGGFCHTSISVSSFFASSHSQHHQKMTSKCPTR